MGSAFANSQSSVLKKEEFTVHLGCHELTLVDLWEKMVEVIQNNLESESDDRLFRLILPNIGMLLENRTVDESIRFLRSLKSLVRSLNGVCLISVDENLLDKHVKNHLDFLADSVLKLTSFKDHQEMKIGDYDGTIKLLKQPKLHGLICSLSDFDIYALRLKGKTGIIVEKIHLEPEDDRAGQDENLQQKGTGTKKQTVASVQCNPTKSHQLDF